MAVALGQGCPLRQLPSISRAAIPTSRIRGPSAHHIGPSPSQTAIGVHVKERPAATIWLRLISKVIAYSQAMPSRSRSRLKLYPGSPALIGAAPAARASLQLLNLRPEFGLVALALIRLDFLELLAFFDRPASTGVTIDDDTIVDSAIRAKNNFIFIGI
jgi:hypothetical protein